MDPATAAKLREAYREDIKELSQLIGRDLSHWLRQT
jgi:tetrahydromethanopterin S-methyltransferase subunit F